MASSGSKKRKQTIRRAAPSTARASGSPAGLVETNGISVDARLRGHPLARADVDELTLPLAREETRQAGPRTGSRSRNATDTTPSKKPASDCADRGAARAREPPGRSHRPGPVRVSRNAVRQQALSGAYSVGGGVACGAKRSRLRRGHATPVGHDESRRRATGRHMKRSSRHGERFARPIGAIFADAGRV